MSGFGSDEKYQVTGAEFEKMLEFLNRRNESPETSPENNLRSRGERYEEVRRNLIAKFRRWGCGEPEALADETFNRIARRLPQEYGVDDEPEKFVHRVAYFVSLESFRKRLPRELPSPARDQTEEDEQAHECLELCLQKLTPTNRELILEYYREERSAKIRNRSGIARRLGIRSNALRIRACRIRGILQKCVLQCLDFNSPSRG